MRQQWVLIDEPRPATERLIVVHGWVVSAPDSDGGAGLAEYEPGMIIELAENEARDARALARAVPYSDAAALSRGITTTALSKPTPVPHSPAQTWKAGRTFWVPAPGQSA